MGSRTLTEYISIVSISLYARRFKMLHFKNIFYHYLLALSLPRQTVTPWHAFRFLLRRFMPCVKMCDRSLVHKQKSLIQVDLCVQVLASGMSLVLAIANLSYATGKFHKTNDYLMFAFNLKWCIFPDHLNSVS